MSPGGKLHPNNNGQHLFNYVFVLLKTWAYSFDAAKQHASLKKKKKNSSGVVQVIKIFGLTSTFGPGLKRGPRSSGASLQRSGQQNTDLILCVWIQVANLVCGLVYRLQVIHGPRHSAVFHLPVNYWTVSVDGIGVELDPKIGGTNSSQLGWCNRHWGL